MGHFKCRASSSAAGFIVMLLCMTATVRSGLIEDLSREMPERSRLVSQAPAPQVPRDDATVDELLDFWTSSNKPGLNVVEVGDGGEAAAAILANGPSETVRRRLLEACADDPAILPGILNILPHSPMAADTVKAIYDKAIKSDDSDNDEWLLSVHDWLMFNSKYFRSELIEGAEQTKFDNSVSWTIGNDQFAALARLDWHAAEPILKGRAAGEEPRAKVAAIALLQAHARASAEQGVADEWRKALIRIATDRSGPAFARDDAFQALRKDHWNERDAWFMSQLDDPTLRSLQDGDETFQWPLIAWATENPRGLIPKLIDLLDHGTPAQHEAAALLLEEIPDPLTIAPLLPALSDPAHWPSDVPRQVVKKLKRTTTPGVTPLLLKWASQRTDVEQDDLALALARQGAPEAAAAILKAFEKDHDRQAGAELAAAYVACTGVTQDQADAIEAACRRRAHPRTDPIPFNDRDAVSRQDALPELGEALAANALHQNELAEILLQRMNLEKDAPTADALWTELQAWPGQAVDREWIRRLRESPLDVALIKGAAVNVDRIRTAKGSTLGELARQEGERGAIAAGLMEDPNLSRPILRGTDKSAARLLLEVSRIAGTMLPLDAVDALLRGADPELAKSAKAYLIDDGGADAIQIVTRQDPKAYLIFGDPDERQGSADSIRDPSRWDSPVERIRNEMRRPGGPDEIIALFSGGGFGGDGQRIIRFRGETAVVEYTCGGSPVARQLGRAERDELLKFVIDQKIDALPPLENPAVLDGVWYQYVHLTRSHGQLISINNPDIARGAGTIYQRLTKMLRRSTIESRFVPPPDEGGRKMIWADRQDEAIQVWKGDGGEIRVRVRGRDGSRKWFVLNEGVLGHATTRPPGVIEPDEQMTRSNPPFSVDWFRDSPWWLTSANDVSAETIHVGYTKQWGGPGSDLFRCRPGKSAERITDGTAAFDYPVATPDLKWAVAGQTMGKEGAGRWSLVRVDLSNGAVSDFKLPGDRSYRAVAYIPAHSRILVRSIQINDHVPADESFWLVDPATGECNAVTGDFSPILELSGRPLQPSGAEKDEVWAALPDALGLSTRIGKYDLKTFRFSPVVTVKALRFASDQMWVDSKGGTVLAVAGGRVFSIPLH